MDSAFYSLEGWKVTYTRSYDTDYGEIGTIINVTIGNTNIPLGHVGFGDTKETQLLFARKERVARLIASAPDLLNALEAVMMTINNPKCPDAELARGRARYLLAELGCGTHKDEQGQEEASPNGH